MKEKPETLQIPERYIISVSKDILDNPFSDEESALYTREQMLQMFRLGVTSMTPTDHPVLSHTNATSDLIRTMDVGDEMYFPFSQWNTLRSLAGYFKKYNVLFHVTKTGPRKEKGLIKIKRTK